MNADEKRELINKIMTLYVNQVSELREQAVFDIERRVHVSEAVARNIVDDYL